MHYPTVFLTAKNMQQAADSNEVSLLDYKSLCNIFSYNKFNVYNIYRNIHMNLNPEICVH